MTRCALPALNTTTSTARTREQTTWATSLSMWEVVAVRPGPNRVSRCGMQIVPQDPLASFRICTMPESLRLLPGTRRISSGEAAAGGGLGGGASGVDAGDGRGGSGGGGGGYTTGRIGRQSAME